MIHIKGYSNVAGPSSRTTTVAYESANDTVNTLPGDRARFEINAPDSRWEWIPIRWSDAVKLARAILEKDKQLGGATEAEPTFTGEL